MPFEIQPLTEAVFEIEKTPDFRVIAVDGAIGGIAPTGKMLHMSIYNESTKLPRRMVHSLEGGRLGTEKLDRREGGSVIARQVEATLVLTPESATVLRDWLSQRIEEFDEAAAFFKAIAEQ